jgi:hypothetical protein
MDNKAILFETIKGLIPEEGRDNISALSRFEGQQYPCLRGFRALGEA